jgi:hypothetical protein
MIETIELQACESCEKEHPLDKMRMMEDCWFCEDCTNGFHSVFQVCDHKWSPYRRAMGDIGQYCDRCCGFVRDEDFPLLFPTTKET